MSEITLIGQGIPDLLPATDRTVGPGIVHVSHVIHDLCIRLGHYDEQDEMSMSRLQFGKTFEHALANRYHLNDPDRYVDNAEFNVDDIHMTPDLVDCVGDTIDGAIYHTIVNEIKLTWMSDRHDPSGIKFWRYWVQIMAYCKAVKSLVGRLHVCHVNGDCRSFNVTVNIWQQVFLRQEIEENWAILVSHAKLMRKEGLIS